jgi:hypothetical protein
VQEAPPGIFKVLLVCFTPLSPLSAPLEAAITCAKGVIPLVVAVSSSPSPLAILDYFLGGISIVLKPQLPEIIL